MRVSAFAALFFATLAGPALAAAPGTATPTPTPAAAKPTIPAPAAAAPKAPMSTTATATATSTPTIVTEAADPDMQDDGVTTTAAVLDLGKAETKLLTAICEATTNDDEKFLFNLDELQRTDTPGPGVAVIKVSSLYSELAQRTINDEAAAGKALALAALRGDTRAKEAKQQAYEDKLAYSVIKRVKANEPGAKVELNRLAIQGNAKARVYLGLDKEVPVAVGIPEAMTGSAVVAKATAIATPAATAAKAVATATASPTAVVKK